MSALTNVWRQLVQRRLWPMAILLIAAAAAVPMALAEDPEPAAPDATATGAKSGDTALAAQPIVAQATPAAGKRRKVLGARKNPFGVPRTEQPGSAAAPNSNGATTAQVTTPTETSGGGSPPASSGGGSPSTGGGLTPPATDPTPEPEPKPKYSLYELTVRFGDATSTPERRRLERLQPLPSAEEPVLIYLGVLSDGKTAVFLVDHGISAVGDGDCRPTPEECETVRMRAGETEFFDVHDETGNVTAQYQLDLVKIHKGTTASASRAKASSKAGRRALQARVASTGPTGDRWDAAAGTLERSPGNSVRATVAGATVGLP